MQGGRDGEGALSSVVDDGEGEGEEEREDCSELAGAWICP